MLYDFYMLTYIMYKSLQPLKPVAEWAFINLIVITELLFSVKLFCLFKSSTEGFSCVPINFDSVLLETQNKVDLIRTVATCELKESCYRVPSVEYYYEINIQADGVKEERLKVS